MAQIQGQIESLKKLKYELKTCGIHRFNSIKEINDFLFNFQEEKEAIINTQKEIIVNEIRDLNLGIKENQDKCERTKSKTLIEIEVRIDTVKINIDTLAAKVNRRGKT